MSKQLFFDLQATQLILQGINLAADAIKITAGPLGRNVILSQTHGHAPLIVNDGATIAQALTFTNPTTNVGANLVKQVATATNSFAGDGTTTAVILFQALVNGAFEFVNKTINPIVFNQQLSVLSELVLKQLAHLRTNISDQAQQIFQVATIAANSEKIGKLLAHAFLLVGPDGLINVEHTNNLESSLATVEGFVIQGGYQSRYLINDKHQNKAIYHNLKVLVCDLEITNLQPLLKLLETANKNNQPLLIVGKNFSEQVTSAFALNHLKNLVTVLALKPTNYYGQLDLVLQDVAVICQTHVVTNINYLPTWEQLGTINQVIMDEQQTYLFYDHTNNPAYTNHLNNLTAQLSHISDQATKTAHLKRMANLQAHVAVIKIAGATEIEQQEKAYRLEDAINATRHALQHGIVPGGGNALKYIATQLAQCCQTACPHLMDSPAYQVIQAALISPWKQILINAGGSEGTIAQFSDSTLWMGYHILKQQEVNLLTAGIIDPYMVTYQAWTKAISVTQALVSTSVLVVDEVKKPDYYEINQAFAALKNDN